MISEEEIKNMINSGMTPEEIFNEVKNSVEETINDMMEKDSAIQDTRELYNAIGNYLRKYFPNLADGMEVDPTNEVIQRFYDMLSYINSLYKYLSQIRDNHSEDNVLDSLQTLFNELGGLEQ